MVPSLNVPSISKETAKETAKAIQAISKQFDDVNRPKHYADGKIEVIDYIEDKNLGFALGNAIKYISRAGKKQSADKNNKEKTIEDLRKAVWYINRRIKEIEEGLCD